MSDRPLLIVHGWSDSSASFKKLASLIETQISRHVQEINLTDYISMDDDIMFFDLAAALQHAWLAKGLPTTPGSVDVIAHSTGGLVVRTWLQCYYVQGSSPIKNLVLLAPANFGSALAHKGRAFLGRVIKGFNSEKMFQVGSRLLKGLELASPFTFNLALADRFNEQSYFGPGEILCTVLVGNKGYSGIAAAANEDGSDGTVRIASANLNCALVDIDFYPDPLKPSYTYTPSSGQTAFAIMDGENHSTIIGQDGGFASKDTLSFILRGLLVTDNEFEKWCDETARHTQLMANLGIDVPSKHGFQNTVCKVYDQFQQPVDDYFLEFFGSGRHEEQMAELFHDEAITNIHPFCDDPSYRSLYINCTKLYQEFNKANHKLLISLTALPEFEKPGDVGYRTFSDEDMGSLVLKPEDFVTIFQENRTVLVRIKLKREQSARIFKIKQYI